MFLSRMTRFVRSSQGNRVPPARRRGKRLAVESLETRTLMAVDSLGAIAGVVRDGASGNGLGGVAVTLFADTDSSGALSAGDAIVRSMTTSSSPGQVGQYRFSDLTAGVYFLQQAPVTGYLSPAVAKVTVSADAARGILGPSIDSFDLTPQAVSASAPNPISFSAVAAPEAIGGERELYVAYSSGVGSIGHSISTSTGFLQFGAFAGTMGVRTVTWDGADGDEDLDRTGLGGLDLTVNPNNTGIPNSGLAVSFRGDIPGGTLTLIVYSGPGGLHESRVTRNIPTTLTNEVISFSEFVGADFTDVGAIVMEVSGSSDVDADVSNVAAIGPTVLRQDLTNTPQVDLSITKTDGQTQVAPGQSLTYTIVVTNHGPTAVSGARVVDNFPAGLTDITYTSVSSGQASGNSLGGAGAINDVVNLGVGASITYTVSAKVAPGATGVISNTATVTAPAGASEMNLANNSATDTDTLVPQADLTISKTDGLSQATPGQSLTYTIVVRNTGPSNVSGASVVDNFPTALRNVTYTATASGGATGHTSSGAGAIQDTVSLPAGASITYVVQATVAADAAGSLVNTATVTAPAGVIETNTANNTATDTDILVPRVDLSITKTDGVTQAVPGQSLTYTIVVRNSGPSFATGARVADVFPAALSGVSYTSSASSGASGNTASGSGTIDDTVTLAPGASITYTVQATVAPTATGSITNTATVTAPAGAIESNLANNSASDTDTLTPRVDLAITKSDGLTQVTPGQSLTYTIVVTNNGPSAVSGARVTDVMPAALTGVTYTSTSSVGGSGATASGSGSIDDAISLAPGASITYTVQGTVSPSATGTISNTATVATPIGVTDINPSNNSANDIDTLTPRVDLSVTKTDGLSQVAPGQSLTYTIVVRNNGPSTATGARVVDNFPAALTGVSYTSVASSGATGNSTSGNGPINDTVNLAPGATITYTVQATVAPSATGNLTNTATVTAATGTVETNPANNSATDTDTLVPRIDLAISKTDGVTQVAPGQSLTYTIVVTNHGPSNAVGARVVDNFPASLSGVTYTSTAGVGASGNTTSGEGNINDTVNLAPGASITYTVQATVSAAATGTLTNTATVTAPAGATETNTANNSATDTDTLRPLVDLAITKTDGLSQIAPGQSLTYTIVATNNGPSNVVGARIVDNFPAALTNISYTSSTSGAASGNTASGTGAINDTVNIASGASITYIVQATVSSAATGVLTNTATVSAPSGVTETNTNNNSATDTDTLTPKYDLTITKNDGVTTVTRGQTLTYTIVVRNRGPSDVRGARVEDVMPSALTNVSYTSTAAGGATGNTASGIGSIGDTVNLPAGASITYRVRATVAQNAPTGTITNRATVSGPATLPERRTDNNTAIDTNNLPPPIIPQNTASISGFVYYDLNGNGVRDSGDLGIQGVTITLRRQGAADVTTTTAADGSYRFSGLVAGRYSVIETQPAGFEDGTDTIGNAGGTNPADNVFAEIALTGTQTALGYNFGERLSKRRYLGSSQ